MDFFLKSEMKGPTYLLIISWLYSLSELLTYNPAVSSIKGVVGRPGMKIPAIPKKSETVPRAIKTSLSIILFVNSGIILPGI